MVKIIEKIINQKMIQKTGQKMTTIQVYKDKGQLDVSEVTAMVNVMIANAKKSGKKIDIMVKGLLADNYKVLKYWGKDLDIQEFEDYYANKVEDTDKFEHFSQLQIYVLEN